MRPECSAKDVTKTMGGRAFRPELLACLLLPLACAATPQPSAREVADANDTGQALTAKTEQDRAVLREVAGLPSGVARRISGTDVIAEAPYVAASGRTCRALQLGAPTPAQTTHRLACSDGQSWFFVPDVFGSSSEAGR